MKSAVTASVVFMLISIANVVSWLLTTQQVPRLTGDFLLLTPPLGVCLFVESGIARISLEPLVGAVWPFMVWQIIVLLAGEQRPGGVLHLYQAQADAGREVAQGGAIRRRRAVELSVE